MKVGAPSPEVEEEPSNQHLQPQIDQAADPQPDESLALQQDPEPEPQTSGNDMQSDVEEPVDTVGFDGNDSDGGISMPSDDASVGVGGLSDDDFEVLCASEPQLFVVP